MYHCPFTQKLRRTLSDVNTFKGSESGYSNILFFISLREKLQERECERSRRLKKNKQN